MGFHTGQDAKPWWQVDLGQPHPLAQVRLWNRSDTDGSAQRASKFLILLSNDGKAWREVYQHNGQIFYGYRMPDRSPLVVKLTNAEARFVRVQLPGTEFLHLDEVEVIGQRGGSLALNKPAEQSSVSQWSVAHRMAKDVDWRAATAKVLDQHCDGVNIQLKLIRSKSRPRLASTGFLRTTALPPRPRAATPARPRQVVARLRRRPVHQAGARLV